MQLREEQILRDAVAELNKAIREEFALQGHTLTGAAERSLQAIITRSGNKVEAEGVAVEYMQKLNEGIPASEIQVTASYINELAQYVKLRMGFDGKKSLRIAYLIAKKHAVEGVPTEASSRFSQTGERTGFMEAADDDPDNRTDEILNTGIDRMMDAFFSKQQNEIV